MFALKKILYLFSIYIALTLANPLPIGGRVAGRSEDVAAPIQARAGPDGLCFLRSMQTTLNRFRGGIEVDISQALENIRGDDPERLPWTTITRDPALSWRAWRSQVVGPSGRHWRFHIQFRNSGARARRLTIEQPEGVAGTRYIPVDVEAENLVTQDPSITCTMIDNPRDGTYIIRDL
ncbi:hypothetical protein FOMG_20015 [Fusarium oxysporum f. sp. melonis 26406]|uniref:Uncharacterized protein n=1 Tax=Fusarium oxysporum f. sp. melonis 26406 TaxID=1089452 RepID=W9YVK3_FUSOX|nr:hypothetical protein FOMG_20015 [Fusarium oxysporum f. sp. melonis 26406]